MPLCEECGKSLGSRVSLRRHSRETHGITLSSLLLPSKNLVCGSCDYSAPNNNEFERHLADDHAVNVQKENLSFESFTAFLDWKQAIEWQCPIKFVIKQHRKASSRETIDYRCNRDGFFKSTVSDRDRKRNPKVQGSRKINSNCPARISVSKLSDGRVEVEFIQTHFGHAFDLAHLPISSTMKKQVAAKLSSKIPLDDVLDTARRISGGMNRDHLITKQDLRNVIRDFKLNYDHRLPTDDESSVDIWIEDDNDVSVAEKFENPTDRCCPITVQNVNIEDEKDNDQSADELKETVLNEFNRLVHKYTSKEQIELIKNTLKNLEPQLIALNKRPRPSILDSPINVGALKEREPQRRFSLKKKMKKTNPTLNKPLCGDVFTVAIQNVCSAENVPT